ncbi:hypothetical protein ACWA5Z_10450 [Testudinibacter sp. P80/BLE/0925]
MAAEKLTKKRLIQLLSAMIILIGAFSYRSCQYHPPTALESESEQTDSSQ